MNGKVIVLTRKRLMQTLMMNLRRGATARGDYLREKKIFADFGHNVRFQIRVIPLYPELIKIGSNINISSGTSLVTHDAMQAV